MSTQIGIYKMGDVTTGIDAKNFSAFPSHRRPAREDISGKELLIPPGTTVKEYLSLIYPGARITTTPGHFNPPFINRDNKVRENDLGKSDPYIFSGREDGVRKVTAANQKLLSFLVREAKALGIPTKIDAIRQCETIDNERLWESVKEGTISLTDRQLRINLQYIVANEDIIKKTSVNRVVPMGWHLVSYQGNERSASSHVSDALAVLKEYMRWLRANKASEFKAKQSQVYAEASDPKDTNPGYPYFLAMMGKGNTPVTRVRTIEKLGDLTSRVAAYMKSMPRDSSLPEGVRRWHATLAVIDATFGGESTTGAPLSVACIRRTMTGGKWQHMWKRTVMGLTMQHDFKGLGTTRVAWMVSWIYNLLVSESHAELKALRYFLPGLIHDGDSKRQRVHWMSQSAAQNALFIAEADYSNYDRNIPLQVVREMLEIVFETHQDKDYVLAMLDFLHKDASILIPDYMPQNESRCYQVKAGALGLLSGVKLTSETGTLVNFIINLQALMNAEGWSRQQGLDYLTRWVTATPEARTERFHVASDDTALIASSQKQLVKQAIAFETCLKSLGLKSEVLISDRFLMRHTSEGGDTAVPSRVFQNTLSPESPVTDYLIFLVGLTSRCDSLAGFRVVDPFGAARSSPSTRLMREYTSLVCAELLTFLRTATVPHQDAINFLALLSQHALTPSTEKHDALVAMAKKANGALVQRELELLRASQDPSFFTSWLYALYKDRAKPSSALLLDTVMSQSSELRNSVQAIESDNIAFFKWACKSLGIYNKYRTIA